MKDKSYLKKMPRKRVRLTEDMLKKAVEQYILGNFYEAGDVRVSFGQQHITATFLHCRHDDFVTSEGSWDTYYKCRNCDRKYSVSKGY